MCCDLKSTYVNTVDIFDDILAFKFVIKKDEEKGHKKARKKKRLLEYSAS